MYTKTELDVMAKHCSEMEQKAAKAERDSIKFKQVEFMQDKIGQEFLGTVSGANNWGLFVEINENGVDGLVDADELSSLGFSHDEKNYKFVHENGDKLTLGDSVKVKVISVNLTKRQIEFNLIK